MAEAFGVAVNVVGVVSLGLTVCQGLITWYGSWKDAPVDVEQMRESIKALNDIFKFLDTLTKNEKFGSDIRNIVKQSLGSCEGGLNRLKSKLDKVKVAPESDNWNERARAQLRRSLYPFKEGTVEKLMRIANELRNNLTVALQALQM
jgi:ankyrin repeat domain-containing protein 50